MTRLLLLPLALLLATSCAKPTWQLTCGDPVCSQHADNGVALCDTDQQPGNECSPAGAQCDPVNDCNALLQCSVDDPTAGGCPIPRRAAKKDIAYLAPGDVATLGDRALHTRLATWRYNEEPADGKTHVGFIIDDDPSSPAVTADGGHVDLYGYDSMTLAAVQQQAARIDALEAEVRELQAQVKAQHAP